MSIQQFFRILWVRRGIIIITLLAAFLSAVAIVKLIPPRYEAASRVMLDIVRPDPVTGEALSSSFARAYTKTQIELIRDYRVAGRVVDRLGWTGSAELTNQYRASGSDMEFRRWLAQLIIDRTEVNMIDASNILEIRYAGTNPETAAVIADALRTAYEEQTMLFKQQAASRNATWFERQTTELRAALAQAEERKAGFERANGIILQDDSTDTDSARLAALAQAAPPPPMVTTQAAAAGPVSTPSQAQLAQIDASIAAASQTLGPNHPDLQNLRRQRDAIAQAASREMAAARAAMAPPRTISTGPSAGALFNAQRSRVLAQRGKLAEARQLQGDINVLREQLTRTATRAAQLGQESQSTETGLTRLGSAVAPDTPTFPKVIPVLLGSIALGLGLGVLLALLTELLNRRVRSADDLMIEGVPVIGVMASTPAAGAGRLTWRGRAALLLPSSAT
ncbi:MAG: GumC family protein [Sphingopyxis sp.]